MKSFNMTISTCSISNLLRFFYAPCAQNTLGSCKNKPCKCAQCTKILKLFTEFPYI